VELRRDVKGSGQRTHCSDPSFAAFYAVEPLACVDAARFVQVIVTDIVLSTNQDEGREF
jgi:hypothetical protein